ncbi:MAG: insulinase family protein [Phycisphaerales bacterium]|nr:insulinase family protein [Phycisphaerales bacterium]
MGQRATQGELPESYRLVDTAERLVSVFSNGLTTMIQRHDAAPGVAVRVYVRGGSVFEGAWAGTGISHLLEHVITCDGTERRSEKELLDLGDHIGGLVNAYTSVDHICHHVTVAAEHWTTAVEMFADYVVRPSLSQTVFDREMGVVQRELERDRDDPDTRLDEMLHELMYRGHPMQYPVIGHRTGLRGLTREDVLAYYRSTHVPENVVVVIVGDVEPSDALGVVARVFDGWDSRRPSLPVPQMPSSPASPIRAIKTMDVESASLAMAWMTVPEAHEDDVLLDLLSSVMAEGENARLVKTLRWDRGLVYELSATHDSSWHTPGMFQISAQCDVRRLDEVREAVLELLAELETRPIAPSELNQAKQQHLTSVQYQRETGEGLATQLGEDFLATGHVGYSDAYMASIQRATVEDLMRVARKYVRPTSFVFSAIVPETRERVPSKVRAVGSSTHFHRFQLDNGLACVIRHMPRSSFVAAGIRFRGGLLAESEETNGMLNLLAQSLVRGSAAHSGEQIAEMFASRGSFLRSGMGLDQIGCSFTALSEEFEPLLGVMSDVVCSPALKPAEIDKVRPAICDAIARIDEDWHSELTRFARRCFFERCPYRLSALGTMENVKRASSEDLQDMRLRFMTGRNGVLSLAGRVAPDHVHEVVQRCFGRLDSGRDRLSPRNPAERIPEGDRLFAKRSSVQREVAGLFLGFSGLSLANREHRAAVAVLEAMLAGYSLSSGRLYAALRGGDRDMVYDVADVSLTGLLPGYIAFTAGCEPERVADVYKIMRAEVEAIRSGRFDESEVERARNMVVTGELDQLQSPADFAFRMGADELLDLGAADWQVFVDEVRQVSRDDVLQVAGAYLNHATIVVVSPEPTAQVGSRLGMCPSTNA